MAGSGKDSITKAIYYALGANFGIAVAKGVAAFLTGSGSMLAETIHSLSDCVNQLLLLLGLKRSQKPADAEHPLGYGKLVYFWSFIVAMLLFSMGGLFSVYEGVHKLQHPQAVQSAWIALVVLGLSIILEGAALTGALREIKKLRGEKTLGQWLKSTRSSELMVVLGEDAAACAGLALAFVFVGLASLLNMPVLDAVGSICIGVILLLISLFLIVRMRALLIGRSADPDIVEKIEAVIAGDDNIEQVFNTLTIQSGPQIMLAAKVKLKGNLNVNAAVESINALEAQLKTEFSEIKWIFMEMDNKD